MVKALSLIKSALIRAGSLLAALGSTYARPQLSIRSMMPSQESKMAAPIVNKKSTQTAT